MRTCLLFCSDLGLCGVSFHMGELLTSPCARLSSGPSAPQAAQDESPVPLFLLLCFQFQRVCKQEAPWVLSLVRQLSASRL